MINATWWNDPESFDFVSGVTPLSGWGVLWYVPPAYLAVLWVAKQVVARRSAPFDLREWVVAHNAVLSAVSAVLLWLLGRELWRLYSLHGLVSLGCDPEGRHIRGRVYAYLYANYLVKYVELIDTVQLALRGRPTPFLHTYHHAATLILCWSQLRAHSCVQWVPIVLNLAVHVVMYLYFALHALGYRPWWRRLLTQGQILQFVVALVACVAALGSRVLHDLGVRWGPDGALFPRCYGETDAAVFGVGIIFSYLLLFMGFYARSYGSSEGGDVAANPKKRKQE